MKILNKLPINKSALELLKNFYYVILSNIVSVFISILVILVVPKFISIEDYGYWQLYILYTSLVGFLHFGWNDGLYLRFGGTNYKEIDKKLFFSQFYLLLLSQLLIALFGFSVLYFLGFDANKKYVLYMTAICMVFLNTRYMLLFLLQATYRIKEYSAITIFDRVLYLVLIAVLLFAEMDDFKYFIWVDIIAKAISLLMAAYYCKDIVFNFYNRIGLKLAIQEMFENIRVGIKLMFANIASKLIVGNVRLGIETVWTIAVFGKISLLLSITGFVMIFISSISLVLFPFLRKVDESKLKLMYRPIRDILTLVLLVFLLSYYPLSIGLKIWLPQYNDSLKFLIILYPVIIYEGRMSLLSNTYLKVLRKEGLMLKINIITFIISIFLTLISVFVLASIDMAVYSILLLIFIKFVISELYIQKFIEIKLLKDIYFEILVVLSFILVNRFFGLGPSMFIYISSIFIYFFVKRADINFAIHFFKELMTLRDKPL